MLKAYRYLYYRIYSWNLRTWGESDLPQLNALIGVTVLLFFNLFNFALVIEVTSGVSLLKLGGIGKIHIVLIGILLGAINYFIFLKDENYKKLKKQFGKENERERRNGQISCSLFVLGSFILFFVLIAVKGPTI